MIFNVLVYRFQRLVTYDNVTQLEINAFDSRTIRERGLEITARKHFVTRSRECIAVLIMRHQVFN